MKRGVASVKFELNKYFIDLIFHNVPIIFNSLSISITCQLKPETMLTGFKEIRNILDETVVWDSVQCRGSFIITLGFSQLAH